MAGQRVPRVPRKLRSTFKILSEDRLLKILAEPDRLREGFIIGYVWDLRKQDLRAPLALRGLELERFWPDAAEMTEIEDVLGELDKTDIGDMETQGAILRRQIEN
jgi:hypothetical protein